MGKIIVEGTLDIDQFWPKGESDADTAKVVVNVAPGAISYQPPGGSPQPTHAYDGAYVKEYSLQKPIIKDGKLTIRLQGLDAPELHYQPQSMKGMKYKGKDLGSLKGSGLLKKYRQSQGETATVQLAQFLNTLGSSPLTCQVVTEVADEKGPAEAIDKYGRFVGNIQVGGIDINLEILRRGWAIVALYNSMQPGEIKDCLATWKTGSQAPAGITRYLTNTIPAFDPTLLYRGGPNIAVEPEGSKKFMHPKLFRRQCTWYAYRKNGSFKSGFDAFLKLDKHDVFYKLDDFQGEGAHVAVQISMAEMVKDDKKVVYQPGDVIFKEAPSTVYAADGKKLESW